MKQKIVLIFFGLLISLVVVEIALRLGGYIYYKEWMKKEYESLGVTDPRFRKMLSQHKLLPEDMSLYRIVCIGDSFTFGEGTIPGYSYPAQLQRILDKKDAKRYRVYNCGVPGYTSAAALRHLPKLIEKLQPDIVIILLGMNDYWNPPSSETILLSGSPKRYYYQLKNLVMDLRVYKVLKFGLDGLRKGFKSSEEHKTRIGKHVNPESIEYVRIGKELKQQGKFEQARYYYEKAIDIDPNNDQAYLALANLHKLFHRYNESLSLFEKVLDVGPELSSKEELYRSLYQLYQLYQEGNASKDKISNLIKRIPSDETFKKPRGSFVLSRAEVLKVLEGNLETMIKLLNSKKILPILQTYPGYHKITKVVENLSKKYNIPLVENEKIFAQLPDINDYFSDDGSHPNKTGYSLMTKNIYEILNKIYKFNLKYDKK